jgi:hypothetical protein
MATAGDVVRGALLYNKYQSALEPVSAEDLEDGVTVLNDMMSSWSTDGVRVGYRPVDSSGDLITAPDFAVLAMKQNLGVMMAPMFQTKGGLDPELKEQARDSLRRLKNATITIPDTAYPDTLPRGSGMHWPGDYRETWYGGTEGAALSRFQFSGNSTPEALTVNTPATFSNITWTQIESIGFTTTNSGTSVYKENGLIEVWIKAQILFQGSGAGYPATVTLYPARNNEHFKTGGVTVALEANTEERMAEVNFGPIGVTKADTLQLMVEASVTAIIAESGFLQVSQCV